jgi:hypothetical protein
MNKFILIICIFFFAFTSRSQTDTTISPATINNAETDSLSDNTTGGLPVFNSNNANNINAGNAVQAQGVSALLGSSRDPFIQTYIMHFMTARFRYRGYSFDNMTVMMNGVRLNNLQNGMASIGVFGGMNDIIRYTDQKTGLGSSRSTFGDIGGYFNLNVFASTFRKGLRASYAQGNRIFKERVSLTYSTGLTKNGWAFSFSGNARYAAQSYIPGTTYGSFGVFLAAEKRFSDNNSLSLVAFGAPSKQGMASYETDEAYALTNPKQSPSLGSTLFDGNAGNNHYNSYWGFQNGQARNSRVRNIIPVNLILTDLIKFNKKSTLTLSATGSWSRSGTTALNYYGVPNPAPDYYKYMPSYYAPGSSDADPGQYAALTQAWQNSTVNPQSGLLAGQVDWAGMYNVNRNNIHTVQNVDGETGKSRTGNESVYIVEERRQDVSSGAYNAIFNTTLKNEIHLTAGTNGAISNSRYYKVVNDLLGGDYWLDLNQFASSLNTNTLTTQYNINDPNKLVKQGDVFGYDYNINVKRFELWGQAEKSFKRFDVYVSGTINETSFFRDGHMVNGLFPTTAGVEGASANGSSGGKSTTLNFLNYGVKGGITYKIDGHNYITVNLASSTKPPLPSYSFVSPHSRNDEIPGIGSEKILSGDITYNLRYKWLKGRITYYYTQINNQTWERSYFDDVFKTNVNYFMTDLNQLNQGLELGLEGVISPRVSIIGGVAYGSYLYTNRPTATISADNTSALLASDRMVYLKNYHVGGTPESASSIGVRYNGKKYWNVGVYFNYFANNYVTINPDRRTAEALAKYVDTDPQVHQITDQEKLPNAYTVDVMGGKSFRFKKHGVNIFFMINNITNNMFKNYGMEQLRHDENNITKFPNKYGYSYGLTYQLSLSYTFY